MKKGHMIEAIPLHKEICSFLIDNQITFHCYNGGLKAILIDTFHPYKTDEFMKVIMKKFSLRMDRETKDYYNYKFMI